MAETWITTTESAALLGYNQKHIQRLIRSGRVKARKFGTIWQVDKASLLSYHKAIEATGKKRGPKAGT